MTQFTNLVAVAAALSMLVGCNKAPPTSTIPQAEVSTLKQDEYCETQEITAPAHCEPGQRVVFLPSRFGNEQLPVLFAAENCDLRYSVVLTNGGVTCVFIRVKPAEAK